MTRNGQFRTVVCMFEDLVQFFEHATNLLRDERSRFSFFNGLGATSESVVFNGPCGI